MSSNRSLADGVQGEGVFPMGDEYVTKLGVIMLHKHGVGLDTDQDICLGVYDTGGMVMPELTRSLWLPGCRLSKHPQLLDPVFLLVRSQGDVGHLQL